MSLLNLRRAVPTPVRQLALTAALGLAAAMGCSGITDLAATYDTVAYHPGVYAINGTPPGAATAINTPTTAAVRIDVTYDFDVAFDFDPSGRPVVLTQRAVGSPQGTSGHEVSLQPLSGAFADMLELPTTGWVSDSLLTVSVGQVVGVRTGAGVCLAYASPYMYSKMVVDSVSVSQRRLWLSLVTDPNCGFRGVGAGRPKH